MGGTLRDPTGHAAGVEGKGDRLRPGIGGLGEQAQTVPAAR